MRLDICRIGVRSKLDAKRRTLPVRYSLACHVRCTFKYFGSERFTFSDRGIQGKTMLFQLLLFSIIILISVEPKKLCESSIALDFRTQSNLIGRCKPSVEIDKQFDFFSMQE